MDKMASVSNESLENGLKLHKKVVKVLICVSYKELF